MLCQHNKRVIKMIFYAPIKNTNYLDFYEIPYYSNYCISKKGEILNKTNKKILEGGYNPDGYKNLRITDDYGNCHTWGLHRLLAYVFLNPNCSIIDLVVNHKDGIKGNNDLSNLEWVTEQENHEHAGLLKLTSKCLPISVRDVDTGEVIDFPSIVECSRFFNVSKDYINYRVKAGEKKVFPERKHYRLYDPIKPWHIPDMVENKFLSSTIKPVMMKNLINNTITYYPTLSHLSSNINVPLSTLNNWLYSKGQPVLPGFIQLKLQNDKTPWREISDIYIELSCFTGKIPVKIIHEETKEIKIFTSCNECAIAMNLNPSALSYRLKSNGEIIFKDGFRYGYYPY